MERYIGLDVHAQTTAFAVVSASGRQLSAEIIPTSARELIDRVQRVKRPRAVCLEEGNQSAWLSEVLTPHVDQLVVTVPTKRDRSKPKNDVADAYAVAEQLRRNAVDTRVFKAPPSLAALRSAFTLYARLNEDTVRAKNRLKALFSSRGVSTAQYGHRLYDPPLEVLEELQQKLPVAIRFSAEAQLEQISGLENLRERAAHELVSEAKKEPAYRRLLTLPAIGEIRAATLLAVVVTPHRFRASHLFWKYCGLALRTVVSSEWAFRGGRRYRQNAPMTRGLEQGNPHLKNVFKGAALTLAVMNPDEQPLAAHYQHLLRRGLEENLARVTIARKLAAITLAVWKNEEDYDPKKHTILT